MNYNPNANEDDGSCVYYGCTDSSAVNYDPNASLDDGSCVIYGCTINAWFICPESYNPNATVNDWSMCSFTWEGCGTVPLVPLPEPGAYPTIELSEITDDEIDAYYYLGSDKVGCMDKDASNYSKIAVVDNESCIYTTWSNTEVDDFKINVYPQPATTNISIEIMEANQDAAAKEFIIHNTLGETLYFGTFSQGEVININTTKWNTGIYYVLIKMENRNITYKFAIE